MAGFTEWLFNPPAFAPLAAAIGGALLLAVSLVGGDKASRYGGLAILLLGLGWIGLSRAVATPTEKAADAARNIVDAYQEADWDRFETHITPRTRLGGELLSLVGDDIVTAARATRAARRHGDVTLDALDAERDPAGVRVTLRVASTGVGSGGQDFKTQWQLDYVLRDGEPRLSRVQPMDTPVISADAIEHMILRR